MLFKNKNFIEGVEALIEIQKYNQDLLDLYMKKREYEKIINLCENYGSVEPSFWGVSLNYFLSKENRQNLDKLAIDKMDKNFEIFLEKLLDSKVMAPVNVLDIIYEKNNDIPFYIVNNFMSKSLDNEIQHFLSQFIFQIETL